MSSINFDNPWLLLLAVPVAALFIIPYAIVIRKDNISGHNIASGIIHIVMAVLIAFAAAGTSVVTTMTETDVYVLADVSYSASKNLDAVDEYIAQIKENLPDNSRLGVICFAKDYKLVTKLGGDLSTVKGTGLDESSTDISGALDYAGALFRDDVVKRIVLITDGKQTTENGAAELKSRINSLAERDIHVDAVYLDDNLRAGEQEVQLCSVDFTHDAYLGNSETVRLQVRCNYSPLNFPEDMIGATIKFTTADGQPVAGNKAETAVTLTRGYNNFTFKLPTDTAGTFDYVFSIDGFGQGFSDGNDKNNTITFTQTVGERGKVLLICNADSGDYGTVEEILGEGAADVVYPEYESLPVSVDELCVYDQIVLSDVDLVKSEDYPAFLRSLDTVVTKYGKSLLTFGDLAIENHQNGELKQLDELLPVKYGAPDGANLYTIVVDTSRSMQLSGKMARAKNTAKKIVNSLGVEDEVILIEVNGNAYPIIPNGEVGSKVGLNREKIIETIDKLGYAQGTDIGAGLNSAVERMKSNNYSKKRLMLISDGLNLEGGTNDPYAAMQKLREMDVYSSTFDVGRDIDGGRTLMAQLATKGGGIMHDISDDEQLMNVLNTDLPQDIINGGAQDSGSVLRSRVTVRRSIDPVLDGVEYMGESFTQINKYAYAKEDEGGATTVLTVKYNKNSDGLRVDVPLYAYKKCGKGKVATFTSTLNGAGTEIWSKGYGPGGVSLREKLYLPFFRNVFEDNLAAERRLYPFELTVEDGGGFAMITVAPESLRFDAEISAELTTPAGKTVNVGLAAGSTAFTGMYSLPTTGKYRVKVKYVVGEREFSAETTLDIPYTAEYDSFTAYDEGLLHNALGANGSVYRNGDFELENDRDEIGLYYLSLTVPLLAACAVLFIIDIAVRKLKWEDIRSLFKRVDGKVKK